MSGQPPPRVGYFETSGNQKHTTSLYPFLTIKLPSSVLSTSDPIPPYPYVHVNYSYLHSLHTPYPILQLPVL